MPRGLRCWGRSKGAVPQETSASESDGVERTSSSKARRAHAARQQDLPQYHDILAAANLKQKSITERATATTFDAKLKPVDIPELAPRYKPVAPHTRAQAAQAADGDDSSSEPFLAKTGVLPALGGSPARSATSIVHRQEAHKIGMSGWGAMSLYTGEEADGQRHGQGRETWPNGISYSGSWKNNSRHGLGEWQDPKSKQKYIGQWRDGSRHGWGVFETAHIRYEGYWVKNMISGKGECIYLSHTPNTPSQSYTGAWFLGFREGEGVFRFSNGCIYDGEWNDDSPNGRGVFRWPSGVQLEAMWVEGKPTPNGVFSTAIGMLYEGLDYAEAVGRYPGVDHGDVCGWADELLDLFTEFVVSRGPRSPHGSPFAGTPPLLFDPREGLLAPPPIECWKKVSLIGRGAFGCVYKCLNTDSGGFFAMKQVNFQLGTTRQTKETAALEREVAVLKMLVHENIVRYYGTDRSDENDLCVMMEIVAGGDCASLLKELKGGFPVEVIKRYTADVCRGTAYLHSEGIAHRDIKGGNVLVSVEGRCKLADFGVAAFFDQISGSVRGTPYYLSPEMIRGEASTEMTVKKSDVWSIGCTLFEFATANPPWRLEFGTAPFYFVVGQIKPNDAVPLSIPPELDEGLANLIRSAMSSDPEKRPTAEGMLTDPFLDCTVNQGSPLPLSMLGGKARNVLHSSNLTSSGSGLSSRSISNGSSTTSDSRVHGERVSTHVHRASKLQQALSSTPVTMPQPNAHAAEKADAGPTRPPKSLRDADLRFKCVMDTGGGAKVFSLSQPVSHADLCRHVHESFGSVKIAFTNAGESHAIATQDDLVRIIAMHHADPARKASIKFTLTTVPDAALTESSSATPHHSVTLLGSATKNSVV